MFVVQDPQLLDVFFVCYVHTCFSLSAWFSSFSIESWWAQFSFNTIISRISLTATSALQYKYCPPSCVSSHALCVSGRDNMRGAARCNRTTGDQNCPTHSGAGGSLLPWWTRSTHGYVPIERTDRGAGPLHRVSEAG